MTDEEEKKLQELMQYDVMGQPIQQTTGWGTFPIFPGQDVQQNYVAPVIVNPNPNG